MHTVEAAEYEDFHALSSLAGWQVDRLHLSDSSTWPAAWKAISVRAPDRLPCVPLPAPDPLSATLTDVLSRRRSRREPGTGQITDAQLGTLLGWGLGLRADDSVQTGARRRYPSAGARFPVDCYVLALRCETLSRGLYLYSPFEHGLLHYGIEVTDREVTGLLGFGDSESPRAVLVLSATMDRTVCKYGNRGYRYALIEAGHIMQNLYLLATAMDLPLTAVGGFSDLDARRLVDGTENGELPMYCAVLP